MKIIEIGRTIKKAVSKKLIYLREKGEE